MSARRDLSTVGQLGRRAGIGRRRVGRGRRVHVADTRQGCNDKVGVDSSLVLIGTQTFTALPVTVRMPRVGSDVDGSLASRLTSKSILLPRSTRRARQRSAGQPDRAEERRGRESAPFRPGRRTSSRACWSQMTRWCHSAPTIASLSRPDPRVEVQVDAANSEENAPVLTTSRMRFCSAG